MTAKSISEQILEQAKIVGAARSELDKTKAALEEATKALQEDLENEEHLQSVETLSETVEQRQAELDKAQKSLDGLKRAEQALAQKSAPAGGAPAFVPKRKDGEGNLWKVAAATFKGYCEFGTQARNPAVVKSIIDREYKDQPAVSAVFDHMMQKTAVNPATTGAAGWAAELVQTDVQGFLDALAPVSVAAALARRSQLLNFDGFNSVTVPRLNNLGATPTEPAWVAEAAVIPLTQFQFGSTTINRYKLAAITTMSREIADRSMPSIEGILRNALSLAYAQVLDNALLSNSAAVANVRPAGLLNGLAGANTGAGATGATALEHVITDLKAMLGALMANRMGGRPVLLVNDVDRLGLSMLSTSLGEFTFRDELASGRLMGIDVISSANVPTGTAILVDAQALATAFDAPMFDVSDVATVTEANADGTAPTQANNAAGTAVGTAGQVPPPITGGIGVVEPAANTAATGYTARSLWQTWSLGIRMVAPTSWALLRPGAVAERHTLAW